MKTARGGGDALILKVDDEFSIYEMKKFVNAVVFPNKVLYSWGKSIRPALEETFMPAQIKPAGAAVTGKPASFVKFSDKLTDSIHDIAKIIEQNKEMIDSIQEIAIELTSSIGSLHALTVKYARIANQILDVLLPILKNLPVVPKNVMDLLVNLESVTQKIIDNEPSTSKTIGDVRSGLNAGDVNKIKGHAEQLKNVTKTLTAMLPK